jgi:hypothetical protein
MSHPTMNTLRFACDMAERSAEKYAAPSIKNASRFARSMRQQLRLGTSTPLAATRFSRRFMNL